MKTWTCPVCENRLIFEPERIEWHKRLHENTTSTTDKAEKPLPEASSRPLVDVDQTHPDEQLNVPVGQDLPSEPSHHLRNL